MSERSAYDALPRNLPREVRSNVLAFEQAAAAQKFRYDKLKPDEEHAEGGAVIPVFKYDDLPPDKKRIRLLRLYPGVLDNPQIDCELFEAEFDDKYNLVKVQNPEIMRSSLNGGKSIETIVTNGGSTIADGRKPISSSKAAESTIGKTPNLTRDQDKLTRKEDIIEYEALSWRWGDEKHGECAVMIHRDGALYRKRVSQTLGLALKYLRFEKDRIIWIDAICINQEDDDERSSQVSMMSLVYTGATQVCVWLGEDDEESTMAIRFIRNEIKGLKNFDQLCTDQKNAKKWGTLLGLMQRDWFSRRWVVQEVVLARKATVYCGPDKLPWRELAIAVELFVEVETATHRLSELMKKDENYLIPNWFEHISELGASLLVNATARVFRESRHGERALAQRSLLSLEYLVTSLSIFDCGRPHDSVYALVAVARDARPFAPSAFSKRTKEALVAEVCSHYLEQKPYVLDYNRPYADVCKDFVHFCVLRCASTDKIQALNILCRPWAKDWRPGEYSPTEIKDNSNHPKFNHANRTTIIKREAPWTRCLELGELKKRSQSLDERDTCRPYFFEFFEHVKTNVEMQNLSDGSTVEVVDNRDIDEYRKTSEIHRPVGNRITRWFPTRTHVLSPMLSTQIEAQDVRKVGATISKRKKARKFRNAHTVAPEINVRKENELGLPSWVAKITAAPFDIFPHAGMDMVKMGRKNADSLAGIPQDGHRNYSAGQTKRVDLETLRFRRRPRCNHYSLYVKGFWFDTVEEVAQVSQGGAIPGTWLDLAGWSEARRPTIPGTELEDPPDEFWRTLVADRGRHDRNPPYYYARACRETIIKGGLQSGAVDTSALIHNERNSIIAEFCRRVQSVIWNRALIRTENGALGLVSDKVRAGDRICIIYGCTVPIILRKKGWKTQEQHELEEFEDGVEAMKSLMRKCEDNRARKARWEESKKEMTKKDLDEIQKARRKYNNDLEQKDEKKVDPVESHYHATSDGESEDDDDEDTDGLDDWSKDEVKKEIHAEPGEIEDPHEVKGEGTSSKPKKARLEKLVSFKEAPSEGSQAIEGQPSPATEESTHIETKTEGKVMNDGTPDTSLGAEKEGVKKRVQTREGGETEGAETEGKEKEGQDVEPRRQQFDSGSENQGQLKTANEITDDKDRRTDSTARGSRQVNSTDGLDTIPNDQDKAIPKKMAAVHLPANPKVNGEQEAKDDKCVPETAPEVEYGTDEARQAEEGKCEG